jgi:hypothetical protein
METSTKGKFADIYILNGTNEPFVINIDTPFVHLSDTHLLDKLFIDAEKNMVADLTHLNSDFFIIYNK